MNHWTESHPKSAGLDLISHLMVDHGVDFWQLVGTDGWTMAIRHIDREYGEHTSELVMGPLA